jgi:hypothetical protein
MKISLKRKPQINNRSIPSNLSSYPHHQGQRHHKIGLSIQDSRFQMNKILVKINKTSMCQPLPLMNNVYRVLIKHKNPTNLIHWLNSNWNQMKVRVAVESNNRQPLTKIIKTKVSSSLTLSTKTRSKFKWLISLKRAKVKLN